MTDVWVVEQAVYSDRHVVGVYATIEDVIAAHPVPDVPPDVVLRPGGWHRYGGPDWEIYDNGQDREWWNGLDYRDCMTAVRFTVEHVAEEGRVGRSPSASYESRATDRRYNESET
jgi:hypothetical protein